MRSPLALASLILGLIPGAAWAGDSVCWIQNGVLLVPAVAAGVNGVFILDTGAVQSQLDATQASEAGVGDAAFAEGEVQLAGRAFAAVRMQVLALDARTHAFPIPIAGVLGSDVLAGQVVEIQPSPCRLRLSPPITRREHRDGLVLPIELRDGAPYVRAGASDGIRSAVGAFRVDTGTALAATVSAAAPVTASSGRLRALSIGGVLFENIPAAPAPDAIAGALGAIGEPIWARVTMRLDYAKWTLTLLNPLPASAGRGLRPTRRPAPSARYCARRSDSWRRARR